MNWDCSLIMRTSNEKEQYSAAVERFKQIKNPSTINSNERPISNKALGNHKKSLKNKHEQIITSRELVQKKSLKRKNTSKKKIKQQIETNHSTIKQEFSRVMPSPQYSQIYRRNARLETQPCISEFIRPVSSAFSIIKTQKQNCKHQSFIISKSKQPANAISSINRFPTQLQKVYINTQQYPWRKISAFCPTQRVLNYPYAQNVIKQIPKPQHMIIQNHQKQSEQKYKQKSLSISFKNIIEHKNQKNLIIDKQNIKNLDNQIRQVPNKTNIQEKSQNNLINKKKRKIQDFLKEKQQIKSITDDSQLSEQYSQIILSYAQLVRERGSGRIQLDSSQNQ